MAKKMPVKTVATTEQIERRIFLMRGQKVLLDGHLAELYGIETKTLKRAVRRNQDRFPPDFMFVLTPAEMSSLRYQIGTLRHGQHAKHASFAFTEQGVAMLSSVLNSPKAIQMNIEIMRVFVHLRGFLATHNTIATKSPRSDKSDRYGNSHQAP